MPGEWDPVYEALRRQRGPIFDLPTRRGGLLGMPSGGGLLGRLDEALAPYGGMANVGAHLLANSGPSPYGRGTGEVLGTSLLQARQTHARGQEQDQVQELRRGRIGEMRRESDERDAAGRALRFAGLRQPSSALPPTGYKPDNGELAEHPLPRTPNLREQYQLASQDLARQGYAGPSFNLAGAAQDLLGRQPMPTDDMREYEQARAQGFRGTLIEFLNDTRYRRRSGGYNAPSSYDEFTLSKENPAYAEFLKNRRDRSAGFEPRAADSNFFRNSAAMAYGGTYDPQTGQFSALDPDKARKATLLSARAARIWRESQGEITHSEAFEEALGKQSGGAPASNELPDPAQHKGKRIRDNQTGKVLRSDGKQWLPE